MTEAPPPTFGADRFEIGPSGEIVLACPEPKSWTARTSRSATIPEHPGTAVEWGGRLFEVRRAEPTAEGGMRYSLAAWEEGHAIRRMERYDEVAETIRADERRDRSRDLLRRRLAIGLAPLYGLLPAETQKKMEHDFGAPAIPMTVASALPLFLAGFLGLVAFLVESAGGSIDLPAWIAPPPLFAAYLFGESALRLASALAGAEPMGSLPVLLAVAAWRAAYHPRTPAPVSDGVPPVSSSQARERFHVLEPALALLSPFDQDLVAGRFDFDAIRWGRITAAVILAASALNTSVSLAAFRGEGLFREILWLLPAGYLAIEQIRRLRILSRGRPAGSVLGHLVRPFAKPLLETPCALGLPGPD